MFSPSKLAFGRASGVFHSAVPSLTGTLFRMEPRLLPQVSPTNPERLRHLWDHHLSNCGGGGGFVGGVGWMTTRWYSTSPSSLSSSSASPPYHRTFTRQLITRNRRKATPPQAQGVGEEYRHERSRRGSILPPALAAKISIRSARPEDCGDIMGLILDFAEWEGNSDKVEITEEDLIRDGFGETPYFRCVVAEASGDAEDVTSVMAYAMYNLCYCAWKGRMLTWEDIYVHQDYRGLGLGAILLHQVGKYAYGLGCRRVSGYVDAHDTKLTRWYQNYGFVDFSREHDYHIYSLSDDSLQKFVAELDPFEKSRDIGIDVDFSI